MSAPRNSGTSSAGHCLGQTSICVPEMPPMRFLRPAWRPQGLQVLRVYTGPHLSNSSEAVREMAPGSYIRTNKTDSSPAQGRYTRLWPLHESQLVASGTVSLTAVRRGRGLCVFAPAAQWGGGAEGASTHHTMAQGRLITMKHVALSVPQDERHRPHFTEEETEAQRAWRHCQGLPTSGPKSRDSNPDLGSFHPSPLPSWTNTLCKSRE